MKKLFLLSCLMLMSWPALASALEATGVEEEKLYQVTVKDAEEFVAKALEDKGAGDHIAAVITGLRGELLYENDRPVELDVKTLRFDAKDHRWSGNMLFGVQGEVVKAMPLEGRFEQLIEVPVLSRKMVSGETIKPEDIEMTDLPESKMRKGVVTDKAGLEGKVIRRMISAGRPVRDDEVENSRAIIKGAAVNMIYKSEGMEIRATGEALEPGALGDTIRVRNETSKTVVHGKITGPNEVTVSPQD